MTEYNFEFLLPKSAFNEVYLPYMYNESRYLVLCGGAGSGKSFFAAQRFVVKILESRLCNILVVRNTGDTNRNSTFSLFRQIIYKWHLSEYFKVNLTDFRITCLLNGNMIIFKGLDNSEKLKSVTFPKGELTDIWIEEASEVAEQDFNQLDVRLRGKGTKKQIVLSFNPVNVNHWLKRRFADNSESDNITYLHTTYTDNKFVDDEYKKLLESYKDSDPYYYSVYCLGQWGIFGDTIFDARMVSERINTIESLNKMSAKTVKTGFFTYKDNGVSICNIEWHDDPGGYIKIYRDRKDGVPYVIGGDTSGDGSDFFVGQVLDNTNGMQVAVLRHRFDEDLYAKQLYCLGTYFNVALIGVECNYSTYPIKELQRLNYPNQYVRRREDTYTHLMTDSFGFMTTSVTRPVIISELVKVCREDISLINDLETLNEMLTFIRNEKGRPQASINAFDDCIMALAIAHYIRPQMGYTHIKNERDKLSELRFRQICEDYANGSDEDKACLTERWGNIF